MAEQGQAGEVVPYNEAAGTARARLETVGEADGEEWGLAVWAAAVAGVVGGWARQGRGWVRPSREVAQAGGGKQQARGRYRV